MSENIKPGIEPQTELEQKHEVEYRTGQKQQIKPESQTEPDQQMKSEAKQESNPQQEQDTNLKENSFDTIGWENWYTPVQDAQPRFNHFEAIGWATLIYALVFGVCLYRNLSGIMTVVAAIATVIYILYCSVRLQAGGRTAEGACYGDIAKSRKLYPYYVGIVLLGISVCCTTDTFIIDVDYAGMFLLVLCVLIRIFCDDRAWGFGKNIAAMLEMTFSPILYIDRSCRDYAAMGKKEKREKNGSVKYVIIGALIAVPVLFVVVVLLASADAVFFRVVNNIVGDIHITGDIILFPLFVLCVFVYVYGLAVKMSTEGIDNNIKDRRTKEPVIGITFTGILTFVYLVFSVIQIMYLFASDMMLPDGYSYARYARQGFFQLLFVAFLNLLIVLFSLNVFRKHRVLDIILTVMSVCTYIMIASSAVRMIMYIKEYDLTYLRILVLLALLMIAVEMAGVVISIYRDKFPMVRYTVFAVGIIWIVFSFCRPGYIIAKYNISRMEEHVVAGEEKGDLQYLVSLGDDAAPALYQLAVKVDEDEKLSHGDSDIVDILSEYFGDIRDEWKENDNIRGFNFARYQAYARAREVRISGMLHD